MKINKSNLILLILIIICPKIIFSPFCSASPEIIGVKDDHKQTDRETEGQIIWRHIQVYVDFFFQINFLPPYSLRSQGG